MHIHSQGKIPPCSKRFIVILLHIILVAAAPQNMRASCRPPSVSVGYIAYDGFNVGGATECGADPGLVWVEWGTNTNYGNKSSTFAIGQVPQYYTVPATFIGGPTTIMHYRGVAVDTYDSFAGTNTTGDQTFLTEGWAVITNQPQSQTVGIGSNVTFNVGVMSGPDLGSIQYQWSKNGTAITNATNSTLTLTNVQPTDAGNYSVKAENMFDGGGLWQYSSNAVLTVTAPGLAVQLSGSNIVLSWPVAASEYFLESSAIFGTNNWTTVSTSLTTNSTSIRATLPVTGPRRFYRLHHY